MRLVGHADLLGRAAYQPTLHTINGRVYLFVGHFGGTTLPSGLTLHGLPNGGTSIVDVTEPANPKQVNFIPSNGSQMVRVCDGGVIGQAGHYYMLRNTSNTHEVWDVTNPASTTIADRLSVIQPAPGAFFTNTHKNWWECDTGIAYIVAGAGTKSAAPDGWTTNQHIKIYDLSNPSHPAYIRDIGLVGQNPGSAVTTATSGVHGPISIINEPGTDVPVERIYVPYGTSSNGVLQILYRQKVLPPPWGTWNPQTSASIDPRLHPTDDDLRSLVVGSMDMTPTEGAHTSFPIFNVPLTHYQGFTSSSTRDLVALISEETDNHCQGAPHFGYLVDASRTVGAGAAPGSTGEKHPMVISTMQVHEDSANPDFCTRGTRFGPHSTNESFYAPYYGKLLFIAYFDGGARVFDIRDPYHPKNVAYFIPSLTANTIPTVVNNVSFLDVSSDNLEVDDRGYIYDVDRVGGGADILELTGCAKQIVDHNGFCQQDQGLANPPD
ncbi:MAG TPA: hypothetical protein VFI82_04960 [Terriglobales bacterium]|jgi:hypothetical protein|nr:hypothetical protein [Terriglobales bacterium]